MRKFKVGSVEVEMSKDYFNEYVVEVENVENEVEYLLDDFEIESCDKIVIKGEGEIEFYLEGIKLN